MDDWRRFANAQRQEQLDRDGRGHRRSLKATTKRARTSDLPATARALRELHAKWQEVAEAPRNVAQRLWDRFRTATDFIRSRCEVYFVKMREERAAALEQRARSSSSRSARQSQDWGKARARFQELQAPGRRSDRWRANPAASCRNASARHATRSFARRARI
jgi:hypothetical protein